MPWTIAKATHRRGGLFIGCSSVPNLPSPPYPQHDTAPLSRIAGEHLGRDCNNRTARARLLVRVGSSMRCSSITRCPLTPPPARYSTVVKDGAGVHISDESVVW